MIPNTIILLGLCLIVLWAVFQEASFRNKPMRWGIRDSFFLAIIVQGTILVILTEGLSIFHLLRRNTLIIGWSFALILACLLFIYLRISRTGLNRKLYNLSVRSLPRFKPDRLTAITLGLLAFQLLTLAMLTYVYPPNNWDSLTYHMPRVMHWQQNQSVASYTTNIERQIESQPFAEYALVNLQIMVKTDQYANFVQFFAFFVCFLGISTITKRLGGSARGQFLAGVIGAAIPMAVLQATNTQTDLVLSQWLICFVIMGFKLVDEPRNYLWVIGTGLSLGLACLTKATAFIFALPFCIWFGIILLRKNWKNLLAGLVIGILALAINSGFLLRNASLFSNPLGTNVMFHTTNEILSPGVFASNTIRTIALNFTDRQSAFYRGILGWLQLVHQFTGFSYSDPRTTFENPNVFAGFDQAQVFHDDFAGNPIHQVLILLTIGCLVFQFRQFKSQSSLIIYALCLILGFIIFSSYLKFQVYGNRLLLPLFMLWAPAIVLVLAAKNENIWKILILGILLVSFNWVFGNTLRGINQDSLDKLSNREQLLFANQPDLYPIYTEFSDRIAKSDCHAVGLNLGENTWEYPFWVMLSNRNWQGRIEHVDIKNSSSRLEDKNFVPCVLISDNSNGKARYSFYNWSFQLKNP